MDILSELRTGINFFHMHQNSARFFSFLLQIQRPASIDMPIYTVKPHKWTRNRKYLRPVVFIFEIGNISRCSEAKSNAKGKM